MSEFLQVDRQVSGIVTITFNRPEVRNALNLATMRTFASTVQKLADDTAIRAVVLTGAGHDAFCSGGDLFELSQHTSEQDALDFITVMGDALQTLERLPVPVIAAVNGYALGGGSEIAIACDLRVVDESVKIGFVQIRLALTPGWGAGQRLLRLIGYSRAMEILLTGRVLHADELQSLGLANYVVDHGQSLAFAHNLAKSIANNPPDVIYAIKQLLRSGLDNSYEDALAIERSLFPPLWAAEPHLHAVEQFLARKNAPEE